LLPGQGNQETTGKGNTVSNDRTKNGPTPRRSTVRAAGVAKRRADLSGTKPWAFRVPDAAPRSQEAEAMASGRTSRRVLPARRTGRRG
jgi:hypothetical protein